MIDVSLKIVYYVLDHFNFESLKVEFDNYEVSVDSKSVQEMLGLPSGGSLLSNMDYISKNNEESCMFEWKKRFENIDKLRLKQLMNELVQTSAADDNFRINFLVLFINTFYESTSMGKCNLNPLYLIRRDIDLSSIDWCDYIVDCLVRTKKVYNPEKESSFFYEPATYLMLLYVDTFKFDHLQVTRKRPTIFYWTSEKIRFLEDILQETGGFGCGHVNEAYVEEEFQESEYNEEEFGGDEVESDGEEDLCDEDEEDFDVNKVYESKISCMYQKMEDLKKDLVVNIDEGVLKFPQSQNLKNWKLLFPVEDVSTERFDFRYVSQKYKEPILTPGFLQVNDEDYGNDFLNDDENVEDYDQGKCSGGQGDGSGPHEGNIGKNHIEGTDGCLNQKLVEDDVSLNLTGIDDRTVNLGEDDHKNKVISDRTVDKIIVAKNDGEGEDVEDCSNKNKDGENVEDCANKNNDSNETRSLKNDLVLSFSLRFSQDSEGSKKSSQSQISSERMTKKKIKDRVILGNPSTGLECVIPNVDVIDANPVSFAPPLGTLEGPSKPISSKHKDINEEATSVVDVKGKRQMKFSYVYKSPFKERLINFKPCLTQVENVVCEWLFSLQGNPGLLNSWSRILNHEKKFRDVVNSPLRLFMHFDTTLLFEYTHLNETGKYKVFKESFSRSVFGDRDLKVLKDVDMVFFPVLRHEHIYLIVMNLKKRAFEVIDNGANDADFNDKYYY
ncbi:unnamed protein product [Lactuca saligna]|uniref:Ubiquitin-like protease family profile domain-containing protein n=1 Tax=Lactuca saligna TaxID=75948 RepID=A0AA35V1Q6_LACSI|nr:unnamed protein product [Lactuca saligna]